MDVATLRCLNKVPLEAQPSMKQRHFARNLLRPSYCNISCVRRESTEVGMCTTNCAGVNSEVTTQRRRAYGVKNQRHTVTYYA